MAKATRKTTRKHRKPSDGLIIPCQAEMAAKNLAETILAWRSLDEQSGSVIRDRQMRLLDDRRDHLEDVVTRKPVSSATGAIAQLCMVSDAVGQLVNPPDDRAEYQTEALGLLVDRCIYGMVHYLRALDDYPETVNPIISYYLNEGLSPDRLLRAALYPEKAVR